MLYDFGRNPQTGQQERLGSSVEKNVTSALQYVVTGSKPKIYELTGHNEYSLAENTSAYILQEAMKRENYELAGLDLLTVSEVPEDADILLMIAPYQDLNAEEVGKILDFVNKGGRFLFMLDYTGYQYPQIKGLLETLGLELQEGVVVEGNQNRLYAGENPFFSAPLYADHPVLEPLKENKVNVFTMNPQGLRESQKKPGHITVSPLLTSSKDSFIRQDFSIQTYDMVDGDIPGPINVAMTVEKSSWDEYDTTKFRGIVVTSAQMLAPLDPYDPTTLIKGNMDFFMNSLSWVNEQEKTISLRSKSMFMLKLEMTAFQVYLYAAIVVIIIPLLILIAGVIVYLRRKK